MKQFSSGLNFKILKGEISSLILVSNLFVKFNLNKYFLPIMNQIVISYSLVLQDTLTQTNFIWHTAIKNASGKLSVGSSLL